MTGFFLWLFATAVWLGPHGASAADAIQLKVGVGQKMEAKLFRPAGTGPFPAVNLGRLI